MPRFLTPLLALMLYAISGASSAQNYESFRFVGEVAPSGSVSAIEFSTNGSAPTATLSYLNVAGLSTVYDVRLSPSEAIRDGVTVFMPPADFGSFADLVNEPSLNLDGVKFLTGRLVHPELDDAVLPPHWFRMTLHNGVWSGVFRISDRVYSIDRLQEAQVVEVRTTQSSDTSFQPTTQVKLSALVDENYILNADKVGTTSVGHILALESMHVLDGLLADSLGVTLRLDQLIYQSAAEITGGANSLTEGASTWLASNATAFGLTDNLATLIFSGSNSQATTTNTTGNTENNFVVQSNTQNYQLETAHYFGQLLGVPFEENTLQDLKSDQSVTLAAAHWSDQQKAFLQDNPLPAELVRTLSYDAPIIEVTDTEPTPIPQSILDAEFEEITNNLGLLNDEPEEAIDATTNLDSGGNGGGGMFGPDFLLVFLFSACALRRRVVT